MTEIERNDITLKEILIRIWQKISFAFDRDNNEIIKLALEKGDVRIYRYSLKKERLDELVGDHFQKANFTLDYFGKLIHKKDKARYNFLLDRILSGKMAKTTVQYLMLDTKSDKYKYTEVTYNTLNDRETFPSNVYIAIRDKSDEISYKQNLDANGRWLEMITQATEITVWNFNTTDSKFYYANVGFYDEDRPIYISDIINKTHPQDKHIVKSLADLFKKRRNQAFNIEVRVDVTTGKGIWNNIVIYGLPIEIDENGEVNTYSGYMMNITDKVRKTKELETATSIAQKSEELKKQFIANISHYIRTPLNSIMGFGQIIGQCSNDEERQLCLDTMNQNNDNLLKYINDLLEYSSISAGYFKFKKEAFNVSDILKTAILLLENKKTKDIEIVSEYPSDTFVIEWDKDEMDKLFTYLADNALNQASCGCIKLGFYGTTEGLELFCQYTSKETRIEAEEEMIDCFSKPDFDDSLNSLELRLCELISEKADGQTTISTENKNYTEISIHIPCSIVDVGNNNKE